MLLGAQGVSVPLPVYSETFRAGNASCSGLHVYPAPLHAVLLVQYLRATNATPVAIRLDLFGILNVDFRAFPF